MLPWTWFLVRDVPGPLTDLIAILLPLLAGGVVAAAVLVAVGRPRIRAGALAAALSTLVAGTVAVVGPWLPADAGAVAAPGGMVVAAANVDDQGKPLEALRPVDADLWVVPELSDEVREEFEVTYPHHLVGTADDPRIGVFSRYPLRLLEGAGADLPGERIEVDGPTGPFVLYALHIPRPWILGDSDSDSDPGSGSDYQVSVAEFDQVPRCQGRGPRVVGKDGVDPEEVPTDHRRAAANVLVAGEQLAGGSLATGVGVAGAGDDHRSGPLGTQRADLLQLALG
ncbi:MAG: hypothetical protein L0H64_21940, partial [Pseudonocardia sp.]|nr:hypothetical protein [Pseudonocardia sp.]